MKGYSGKILRVDLGTREMRIEEPPRLWYEKYLGGKGLGYRYLLQDVDAKVDPLGPDNEIIFMSGPFAGTIVPTSSRLAVLTKSPATGTILVSLVGGGVAAELKYAGYDGIIICGRAASPVYLYVSNHKVAVEKADALWGKGIHETEGLLREKYKPEVKSLTIGPGGENKVLYACITVDAYHQAGRGGSGAVMGSKNLKAIVVQGSSGVQIDNDMKSFLNYILEIRQHDVLTEAHLWTDLTGTPGTVDASQEIGVLPTRNYQDGQYEKVAGINSDAVKTKLKRTRACATCPLGCGRFTQAKDGSSVEGPEYETIGLAGSNCDVDDMDTLIRFNKLCDDLGLDTISTGGVLAFAMEATGKGIYDFGIHFGEEEKMLDYVKKIAGRRGVGNILAAGVKRVAADVGGQDIAMEVKGLEFPAFDPRGSYGMALAYATSDRGACHQRAFAIEEDAFGSMDPFTFVNKAEVVKRQQDYNSAKDSLIICDFWRPSPETLAEIYTRVTGWPMTAEELKSCGERIWNMGQLFNQGAGFDRKDDYLPPRVLHDPLLQGPAAHKTFKVDEFTASLSELYGLRGWDESGKVQKEKLRQLGMDDGIAGGAEP
ncbi:putative oxidoreductase YdhV [Peptococcaceae bacterium CEB3]|nr:putative oxidoreductase YdhV [Peptococcaceae bacterium CEB3]